MASNKNEKRKFALESFFEKIWFYFSFQNMSGFNFKVM